MVPGANTENQTASESIHALVIEIRTISIGICITNGAKSLGFDKYGNLLSDFGKWDTTHSEMNWKAW